MPAFATWLCLVCALSGCAGTPGGSGGGSGGASGGTGGNGGSGATQSVGGTLAGLNPDAGALELGLGTQRLRLSSNGMFTFPGRVSAGAPYNVEVSVPAAHQRCEVSHGSGTVVAGADITGVLVNCELQRWFVGGTVIGLDAGAVTLSETRSSQLVDAGQGPFRFANAIPWAAAYSVALASAPGGWECTVDGGKGFIEDNDVTDVTVSCTPQRFVLSGTVAGLDAGGLTLAESATAQLLLIDAGATAFAFPEPVARGTAVTVSVAAQPARQLCRVANGAGVVTGDKSDVAVTCASGFTVGGTVNGLTGQGLTLQEVGTGQRLLLVPDGGAATFDFPFVVPAGEGFSVTVASPPSGQNCTVSDATGVSASSDYRGVRVDCFFATADLVINEVSAVPELRAPAWVELYNGTASAKNLQNYLIRAGSLQLDGGPTSGGVYFSLPDASVAAGGLFVVSSKPFSDLWDGPQIRFVASANFTWYFGDGGSDFVALDSLGGGTRVDAVSFGTSGALNAQAWSGAPVALPTSNGDLGKSVARRPLAADTNTAADFVVTEWPTPGGPNDALGGLDTDQDGIPDSAEVDGGRYSGLPLFDWGARLGKRDLFVEVDWVRPDGGAAGAFDPGILPRREALERVREVFRPHNLELHFDVGDLYDRAPGLNPLAFDLGGGNEMPFACTITMSSTPGATSFYQLKAAHADLRRRVSFHHVVFGNSLADVACGGVGATGRSEQGGNDVVVTLGHINLRTTPSTELNKLINWQSSTLMHELGHNLGLRHGGFENRNYKPNYLSVMNYLYQLDGLPVIGPAEGDRYYFGYGIGATNLCAGAPIITNPANLQFGRFADAGVFQLDFSSGTGLPLNEASLDENKGLGRDGGSVDWNMDNLITSNVSANVNAAGEPAPMCPRGSTGADVHLDNDDWSMVTPFFLRTGAGSNGFAPQMRPLRGGAELLGDHHHRSVETLVPVVE